MTNVSDVDQFKQNMLHIAASSGFVALVAYLIDLNKMDLLAVDCNGNTCLHFAARSGMARICWQIAQKNRGQCVRLVDVKNIENQRPVDMIKNEKGSK